MSTVTMNEQKVYANMINATGIDILKVILTRRVLPLTTSICPVDFDRLPKPEIHPIKNGYLSELHRNVEPILPKKILTDAFH